MKKLWWVAVAIFVSAVLNMLAVKYGRGSCRHTMLVLQGMLFLGLPLFIAGLVLMIIGYDKRWKVFLVGYSLNLASLVTGLMLVSACIGMFVATGDVKDAKAYCQGLAGRLEKYKQDTGNYPQRIETVAARENEPLLLKGKQFYVLQAKGYVLEFRDPSRKQRTVEYASWRGTWEQRN
jgi:hypothetical protein